MFSVNFQYEYWNRTTLVRRQNICAEIILTLTQLFVTNLIANMHKKWHPRIKAKVSVKAILPRHNKQVCNSVKTILPTHLSIYTKADSKAEKPLSAILMRLSTFNAPSKEICRRQKIGILLKIIRYLCSFVLLQSTYVWNAVTSVFVTIWNLKDKILLNYWTKITRHLQW